MFSLDKKKLSNEAQQALARIVDLTTPNLPLAGQYNRNEHRQNRTLPIVLIPWESGRPCVDEAAVSMTKDVSEHGISVVLHQPYRDREVVVGFWLSGLANEQSDEEPHFFVGLTRQCTDIGGGYWQLGVEVCRLIDDPGLIAALKPMAAKLVSQHREIQLAAGER